MISLELNNQTRLWAVGSGWGGRQGWVSAEGGYGQKDSD